MLLISHMIDSLQWFASLSGIAKSRGSHGLATRGKGGGGVLQLTDDKCRGSSSAARNSRPLTCRRWLCIALPSVSLSNHVARIRNPASLPVILVKTYKGAPRLPRFCTHDIISPGQWWDNGTTSLFLHFLFCPLPSLSHLPPCTFSIFFFFQWAFSFRVYLGYAHHRNNDYGWIPQDSVKVVQESIRRKATDILYRRSLLAHAVWSLTNFPRVLTPTWQVRILIWDNSADNFAELFSHAGHSVTGGLLHWTVLENSFPPQNQNGSNSEWKLLKVESVNSHSMYPGRQSRDIELGLRKGRWYHNTHSQPSEVSTLNFSHSDYETEECSPKLSIIRELLISWLHTCMDMQEYIHTCVSVTFLPVHSSRSLVSRCRRIHGWELTPQVVRSILQSSNLYSRSCLFSSSGGRFCGVRGAIFGPKLFRGCTLWLRCSSSRRSDSAGPQKENVHPCCRTNLSIMSASAFCVGRPLNDFNFVCLFYFPLFCLVLFYLSIC